MLLKLIKYDFKATYVKFLTTFGIFAFITIILPLILNLISKDAAIILSTFSVALFLGTLSIVLLIFIIQFYHKNLYGNEGYLMSTLPTNGYFLLLSKTIVAVVWTVIASIFQALCLFIFATLSLNSIPDGYDLFSQFCSMLNFDIVRTVASFILLAFITTVSAQIILFFCISLANLPVLGKCGNFLGFVAFFVISLIKSNLLGIIFKIQPVSMNIDVKIESSAGSSLPGEYISKTLQNVADALSNIPYTQIFDTSTIIELVFAVGFFFLTSYLIDKRISLK